MRNCAVMVLQILLYVYENNYNFGNNQSCKLPKYAQLRCHVAANEHCSEMEYDEECLWNIIDAEI